MPCNSVICAYQLFCFIDSSLRTPNGSFALLPRQLGNLVQLLVHICLDKFELGFICAKQLGAGVRIERIRHCYEATSKSLALVLVGDAETQWRLFVSRHGF